MALIFKNKDTAAQFTPAKDVENCQMANVILSDGTAWNGWLEDATPEAAAAIIASGIGNLFTAATAAKSKKPDAPIPPAES